MDSQLYAFEIQVTVVKPDGTAIASAEVQPFPARNGVIGVNYQPVYDVQGAAQPLVICCDVADARLGSVAKDRTNMWTFAVQNTDASKGRLFTTKVLVNLLTDRNIRVVVL